MHRLHTEFGIFENAWKYASVFSRSGKARKIRVEKMGKKLEFFFKQDKMLIC